MFDSLSDRFEKIFARVRGRGRLNDDDVDEIMREIRLALLEADVNFVVVRNFISRARDRCVGVEVSESLTPAQQVVKIVHEALTSVLGGENLRNTYASRPPTVLLLAGLLGPAKTPAPATLA